MKPAKTSLRAAGRVGIAFIGLTAISCLTGTSSKVPHSRLTESETVGACSLRDGADAALRQIPSDAALIACAEDFIRRNGYADAPMETPITREMGDVALTLPEIEQWRRGTLGETALAICHSARESGYDVVFKNRRDENGRAVFVLPPQMLLWMAHQEMDLPAILSGRISRCRVVKRPTAMPVVSTFPSR